MITFRRNVMKAPAGGQGATVDGASGQGSVAKDFGAKNGATISNLGTILTDVDRALGRTKPPALEVIFVEPQPIGRLPRGGRSSTNPFGHALVRYTRPSGEQTAVNVGGRPGAPLITRFAPEEYFYGTTNFDSGNTQGGVYNRRMIGVSVDELPQEQLAALDAYFLDLEERNQAGEAAYFIIASKVVNLVNRFVPGTQADLGNCALWMSKGLASAGIISKSTEWPKKLAVDLFETHERLNPEGTHVVSYDRVTHSAASKRGLDSRGPLSGSPRDLARSVRFWDLGKLAEVRVRVPEGSMHAEVFEA